MKLPQGICVWLLAWVLLLPFDLTAGAPPRNVILILMDGVNQAALDLANFTGKNHSGLGNFYALPYEGTLLPLTGSFRRFDLATLNALALGKAVESRLGGCSETEELESLTALARIQGRRAGFITDGLLNDWTGGVFFAREVRLPQSPEILTEWLPLCDLEVLAGAIGQSAPLAIDPLDGKMRRLGYTRVGKRSALAALESTGGRLFADRPVQALEFPDGEFPAGKDWPTLLDFTDRALDWLGGPDGFFLVIDCAKLRIAAKANDTSLLVKQLWVTDRVIGRAVEFLKSSPDDTLIVVASLYDIGELQLTRTPAENFSPEPKWGTPEAIARDHDSGIVWSHNDVSISLTPVMAVGVGADHFVGEYDAEELHRKLRAALGL